MNIVSNEWNWSNVWDSGTEQLLCLRLINCRRKKILLLFEYCDHFSNWAEYFEGGERSKTTSWFALTAQTKVPVSFLEQICCNGCNHLGLLMLGFVIKTFNNCNFVSLVYNFMCVAIMLALLILNFGGRRYWLWGEEKNGQRA